MAIDGEPWRQAPERRVRAPQSARCHPRRSRDGGAPGSHGRRGAGKPVRINERGWSCEWSEEWNSAVEHNQRLMQYRRVLAHSQRRKTPSRIGRGMPARRFGDVSLWGRSTHGHSGSSRRPCRRTRARSDVPSAAASYARSSRLLIRRSTSWSGAENFPSVSSSPRAALCGTWPRSRHGSRAGGSRERLIWWRRRRFRIFGGAIAALSDRRRSRSALLGLRWHTDTAHSWEAPGVAITTGVTTKLQAIFWPDQTRKKSAPPDRWK